MHVRELFDLTGRVALVTGGSRGLGLEIAEGLGEAGCKLVITARKQAELDAAVAHLRDRGFDAAAVAGSVTDPAHAEAAVGTARERFGGLDILVNNAGSTWGATSLEHPVDAWNKVLSTNNTGAFLFAQAAGRLMVAQGRGGRIINVSSLVGLKGTVLPTIAYNTSKAGLIGFTKTLAVHMAPHDITVNAVCPGFFRTKMSAGTLDAFGEESAGGGCPMGRIGRPGELKGAVVFLAAPAASYVTGAVLSVDGGAAAW